MSNKARFKPVATRKSFLATRVAEIPFHAPRPVKTLPIGYMVPLYRSGE